MSGNPITRHFGRDEMRCPCGCGRAGADYILMLMLETLRAQVAIESPDDPGLHISSGYRCEAHNQQVGGLPDSLHLEGRAADLFHRQLPVDRLHAIAIKLWPRQFGIGYYPSRHFIHIDSGPFIHPRRGTQRRWAQ